MPEKRLADDHLLCGPYLIALLVQAGAFWRAPYKALLNSRHLVEYMILDIEPTGQTSANGKLELADAQVSAHHVILPCAYAIISHQLPDLASCTVAHCVIHCCVPPWLKFCACDGTAAQGH